jgi:hypothetical protein
MGDMLYAPLGSVKAHSCRRFCVRRGERKGIEFIKEGSDARISDEIMEQIEKSVRTKPRQRNGGGNGKSPRRRRSQAATTSCCRRPWT